MNQVNYSKNFRFTGNCNDNTALYNKEIGRKTTSFIKSFPQYSPTPLYNLNYLAKKMGIKQLLVKDESKRFDLNAFKVLGSAFAIGNHIANKINVPIEKITINELIKKYRETNTEKITVTTATDGNHGRGVAWVASYMGLKAIIFMPAGSSKARIANIAATGAEVIVTDHNYDKTVSIAYEEAKKHGRILVQDTAWPGYEDIPRLIMQGYTVIGHEIMDQVKVSGFEMPTHLFLQCGVGSFPAAFLAYYHEAAVSPNFTSAFVEPNPANPFYLTASDGGDNIRIAEGSLDTIMAGLACGVPNPLAWSIARDCCNYFFSCPDFTAALGMRILGNPLKGDPAITSGESGAATCGLLYLLMTKIDLNQARNELALDQDSIVLLINTEGDTDEEAYRRIVWEGEYSSFTI